MFRPILTKYVLLGSRSNTAPFLYNYMKYKHLLFDLDRTLWDFETNSMQTLHEMFTQFQLARLCNTDFKTFVDAYHVINKGLWDAYNNGTLDKDYLYVARFSLTLEHFGLTETYALGKQLGDFYVFESPKKTALFDGCVELLNYLKSKNYEMHIVTNGFREVQYTKLQTSGIAQFFGKVFLSEEIGVQKPHKGIYEYILKSLQTTVNECLMIGDDFKVDIVGAKNMDIDQIFCNFTNACPDFEPTFEVKSLLEIKKIL